MRDMNSQLQEVEQLLRQVRLTEPPDELKAQVLGAARESWEKAPADIPWRVPLRHLGLSAAAAVLIVSCANYFSERATAPWQAGRPVAARIIAADLEDTPEMPYSPLVSHLIATCGSPAGDASTLLNYLQSVRETVNGAEPDEAAEGSGSGEPESREGKTGMMKHWDGGMVAGLKCPNPIAPTRHHSLLAEGVAACIDNPRES